MIKRSIKKNPVLGKFPVFTALVRVLVETAIEAKSKKPALQFANNIWQLVGVGMNYQELQPESLVYVRDVTAHDAALLEFIKNEFESEDEELLKIILGHAIPWVFSALGRGFALAEDLKEYHDSKS
jgi:hypothetical protein